MKPAAPVGRTGPHSASKRGHTHISQLPIDRYAAAYQWAAETGRPLPPHMRPRQPLREIGPVSAPDRRGRYLGQRAGVTFGKPMPPVTGPQRRRVLHKLRRQLAREQNVLIRDQLRSQLADMQAIL